MKGLSPKENREIPPLRYDVARQLRVQFPALTFVVNGGVQSVQDIAASWGFWHLSQFATDYRKLFGVRPSDTLKAARAALGDIALAH